MYIFTYTEVTLLKSNLMEQNQLLAGKKIILAEDDFNSFYLLELILGPLGAEIIHTATGEDTVQAFIDNPDACLILMDIKMEGMDGIEATQKIRELNKDVPIIAQTALTLKNEKEIILAAGCNDIIPKPIDQKLLLDKIQQLVK